MALLVAEGEPKCHRFSCRSSHDRGSRTYIQKGNHQLRFPNIGAQPLWTSDAVRMQALPMSGVGCSTSDTPNCHFGRRSSVQAPLPDRLPLVSWEGETVPVPEKDNTPTPDSCICISAVFHPHFWLAVSRRSFKTSASLKYPLPGGFPLSSILKPSQDDFCLRLFATWQQPTLFILFFFRTHF